MNAVDMTLLRARAADAVERLLDLLDQIDGDPDIELTAPEVLGRGFLTFVGSTDDHEDGHDAEYEFDRIAGGQGT